MRAPILLSFLIIGSMALGEAPKKETSTAKLQVGSAAPSIKLGSWVQGKSMASLKKGQFYVLEFWATWCGPCVKAMPHLSELSVKFKGQVEFIGVNVWEDKSGEYTAPAKVAQFMKDNPNLIKYNVAIDTKDGFMAANWLGAAGINSIPTAIVIGKDGKVAFIGHPMELDSVLPEVIAGKFDAKAYAERPKSPDLAAAEKALKERNSKLLRSEAERIQKGWPLHKDYAMGLILAANQIDDPAGSPGRVKTMLGEKKIFALSMGLSMLASAPWISKSELTQVASWLEQVIGSPEPEAMMAFMTLHEVYVKLGEKEKAAKTIDRFAEFGRKMGLDENTIKIITSMGKKPSAPPQG